MKYFLLLLLCAKSYATFFPGGVITGSSLGTASLGSSLMVTEIARIGNSGTPGVNYESSDWLGAVTDNGVGDSSLAVNSGTFSVNPICSCNPVHTDPSRICIFSVAPTTSSIRVLTGNDAGTPTDVDFLLTCAGIR